VKWIASFGCLLGCLAASPGATASQPFYAWSPPTAQRSIWIDKQHQRLYAFQGSRLVLEASCSTAAHHEDYAPGDKKYEMPSTPIGSYHIFSKEPDHFSKAYKVHMRFALFFDGGRAIHATYPNEYRYLGRPASGGCVRLTRTHAVALFRWAHNGDPVHVVRSLPGPVLALLHREHPPVLLAKNVRPAINVILIHPEKKAVLTALQTPLRLTRPDTYEHELAEPAGVANIEPATGEPTPNTPTASASAQGAGVE